jgi:spore coat protein U-like protein
MTHMSIRLRCVYRLLLACAGLAGALLTTPAQAQSCTVSANSPTFGVYNPSGIDTVTTGLISVSCNVSGLLALNVFYTIQLGMGSYASGTQRNLAGGTDGSGRLKYNLFCDITYSQIWGDGSNGSCVVTGGRLLLLGRCSAPTRSTPGHRAASSYRRAATTT